ncbi:MAG TPA: hypothetical protein VGC18_02290, partial [Lacisediminihabitans sp.]|uniref:hypothetical protein n=1 Tax=Lacisediminihabitans sp. TaxID=2787631 RepID=UPI002EDB2506
SGNRFDRHQPMVEFTFHHLLQVMHPIWAYELYGAPPLNALRIRDMQTMIAIGANAMGGVRHQRSVDSRYFAEYNTPLRRVQNGILTEMDAAVVLLEISRMLPHITVLAAPPQFERSSTGYNVDFLVLDRRKRRVVGVQVKTTVSRATVDRYDSAGIVLVDGAIDLGNTRSVRLRADSSETTTVPWPGLISAHYLAALRPGSPAVQHLPRELLTASRRAAKKVAQGTRSYNNTAVNQVAARVLARLYE